MQHYIKLIESSMLLEGEILPDLDDLQHPITDDMVFRMFHGVDDPVKVYEILTKGLSGKEKANRNYSYESNNNPYGLFVTPDFDTAKRFGAYILELNIRVRDLEAPVWPNGKFAGQGQYAPSFADDNEREEARELARSNALKMHDHIASSSRPEVAASLLASGERQALFTGVLDPNSTQAVWKRDNPQSTISPYSRMSRREFIKLFNEGGATNPFTGKESSIDMVKNSGIGRVLRPREIASLDLFVKRLITTTPLNLTTEKVIEILQKNPDMVKQYVWTDEQRDAILDDLNALR